MFQKIRALATAAALLTAAAGLLTTARADSPAPFTDLGLDYITGRAIFEKIWVSGPASTGASDGLGPRYNARSCAQCHVDGGRGNTIHLVFRLNDPLYGRQIQDKAVPGLAGEGRPTISYDYELVTLADGEQVELRRPVYDLTTLHSGPPESGGVSARLPPPLAGLSLLESIPVAAIVALADPRDEDGDGVSGRLAALSGNPEPGRFGWKAEEPGLEEQVARALSLDLGIGSALLPDPYGDCTNMQVACRAMGNGNSDHHERLEAGAALTDSLMYFIRRTPAPTAPAGNEGLERGEALFKAAACGTCHHSAFVVDGRIISPYSDLLLHDMGPGLADHPAIYAGRIYRSDASASEWRTAPLWGLSRAREDAVYLHDGRARNLTEAILWHGGEAESSRQRFSGMSAANRADLLNFLRNL